MKKWIASLLCASMVAVGVNMVSANELNTVTEVNETEQLQKRPLSEIFDQVSIIAFFNHNKGFFNGVKTDIGGDYKVVGWFGRVLVPIRLMGELANQTKTLVGNRYSYWEISWQQQSPNDVVMTNYALNKQIKLTVGSKTMLVNKEPVEMDVAPQLINGRVMLPLRSIATVLDQKIDWFEGLIIMGNQQVDLQHPQTRELADLIRKELGDKRQPVQEDITLLTRVGNKVFYYKSIYTETSSKTELYVDDGKRVSKLQLPSNADLYFSKVIDNKLYFMVNDTEKLLYQLDLNNMNTKQLAKSNDLSYTWIGDIFFLDEDLYISVHDGDLTIGSEKLYKVANGNFEEILTTKQLTSIKKDGNYLYYSDFGHMFLHSDNLLRYDIVNKKVENIGQQGFTYSIIRDSDEYTESFGMYKNFYIENGFMYVLGYGPDNRSSVYKIDLAKPNESQVKLTSATKQFWLVNNMIYYTDALTGYLKSVDINGNNDKTIVSKRVLNAEYTNGSLYYTAAWDAGATQGYLYQYQLNTQLEKKISDVTVEAIYAGDAGVYYASNGYKPGIYKWNGSSTEVIVNDNVNVNAIKLTDEGIVYSLRYKLGVFSD